MDFSSYGKALAMCSVNGACVFFSIEGKILGLYSSGYEEMKGRGGKGREGTPC